VARHDDPRIPFSTGTTGRTWRTGGTSSSGTRRSGARSSTRVRSPSTPETFPTTDAQLRPHDGPCERLTFPLRRTGCRRDALSTLPERCWRGPWRRADSDRAPWRAKWLAYNLYRDGWTIPRVEGTVRVFATPGQRAPERRYVTVSVRAPDDVAPRAFGCARTPPRGAVTRVSRRRASQVAVCVPPNGYADLRIDGTALFADLRRSAE
jgi:hypothetical protein